MQSVEMIPFGLLAGFVDDKEVGEMKTNLGGKLVLSVELDNTESASVRIEKM